ncbi:MAG: aldehyde dehydrogenase, partial [Nodosilinea sp.]
DRDRAITLLRQLNTGSAYWNCCDRVSPRLPWSGRGHSGLGTTLSLAGLYTFLQPRGWHLRAG